MAFRKRNVGIGRSQTDLVSGDGVTRIEHERPGVRPSSLTSHPVTSTGASSLDLLLGGHGGLVLGSSLFVEENGTTDYAGALLKYFAAEGLCHGHVLHVVGVGEGWVRELPGVAQEKSDAVKNQPAIDEEKMKIAWRYERLGQTGERALPNRIHSSLSSDVHPDTPFCHTFDLTKRLTIPQGAKINHIRISASSAPLSSILESVEQSLKSSSPNSVHRIVIPTILNPGLYPPLASKPENFLRFLQALRSLLRIYPTQVAAMITLPLELYPRSSSLVRWAENISDGVLELTPFPHLMDSSNSLAESGGARSNDEQPQGMVKVHKLPITTERGEGGAGSGNSIGEDLAFTVSRRKFAIGPFSLPPLEGDQEAQKEAGKLTSKDVEF